LESPCKHLCHELVHIAQKGDGVSILEFLGMNIMTPLLNVGSMHPLSNISFKTFNKSSVMESIMF